MSSIPTAVGLIFEEEGLLDIFALGLALPDPATLSSSYFALEVFLIDYLSVSAVIDIELPKEYLYPKCYLVISGDGVGWLSSCTTVKSSGSSKNWDRYS